MKKRKLILIVVIIAALFFVGGGMYATQEDTELRIKLNTNKTVPQGEEMDILIASDIHYLSPDLMEEGLLEKVLLETGDGKITHYSEEIMDAFIEEVLERQPDLLVLSGDLTFDGEKESHIALAEKLSVLKDNDIEVSVIPGNHDINAYNARGFSEESTYKVDSVSAEEFEEVYFELGYETAVSQDPSSLSYVTELSEDAWVIMLDSNKYAFHNQQRKSISSGEIKEGTLEWLAFVLEESKKRGIQPLVVNHHNFLNHHRSTNNSFTLDNSEEVVELLNRYQVNLTFSGHIHLQDIANEGDFYDIASGSLSVYPHYFGEVTVNPSKNNLTYGTSRLNLGETLTDYSKDFFNDVSRKKVFSHLLYFELDDSVTERMTDTFVQFNHAYFTGTIDEAYDSIKASTGFSHWERISGTRYKDYILQGLEENRHNSRNLEKSFISDN
ncbi:metallophosphoesterase [Alkalibacterium putridalgicola]|uniref:metallophosphoesterase n=1 Tax=Alkalibacterium putridalgicola TaxID=426703 RepID=UPI0034CF187B